MSFRFSKYGDLCMYLSVFKGNMIKKTLKTLVFGNVILLLHKGVFCMRFSDLVCKELKNTSMQFLGKSWFYSNVIWLPCFLVLYCLTRSKNTQKTLLVMSFLSHIKLVSHAIWGFAKNVKKKHSKYTHLVMLFCFSIKIVIHKFQHFGI